MLRLLLMGALAAALAACMSPGPCSASNCIGCCSDAGECRPGTEHDACGSGGAACSLLSPAETCTGATVTCNSGNCAGCCNYGSCYPGTDLNSCGRQGEACRTCSANGTTVVANGCVAGACTVCTSSCAGCCLSNGLCVEGTTNDACGKAGLCQRCDASTRCVQNACRYPCDAVSCGAGCCEAGLCVTFDAQHCAPAGATCGRCDAGQGCQSGSCR